MRVTRERVDEIREDERFGYLVPPDRPMDVQPNGLGAPGYYLSGTYENCARAKIRDLLAYIDQQEMNRQ